MNQHITYDEHLPILLGDAYDLIENMSEDDAEVEQTHENFKGEFKRVFGDFPESFKYSNTIRRPVAVATR